MLSSNTAKEKEPKKVAAVHPAVKSVAGAALVGWHLCYVGLTCFITTASHHLTENAITVDHNTMCLGRLNRRSCRGVRVPAHRRH
jgi:hypothetical protein